MRSSMMRHVFTLFTCFKTSSFSFFTSDWNRGAFINASNQTSESLEHLLTIGYCTFIVNRNQLTIETAKMYMLICNDFVVGFSLLHQFDFCVSFSLLFYFLFLSHSVSLSVSFDLIQPVAHGLYYRQSRLSETENNNNHLYALCICTHKYKQIKYIYECTRQRRQHFDSIDRQPKEQWVGQNRS